MLTNKTDDGVKCYFTPKISSKIVQYICVNHIVITLIVNLNAILDTAHQLVVRASSTFMCLCQKMPYDLHKHI